MCGVVLHTHIYIHTYLHNGILLSHKKEWDNAISSNMDEPGDYHTKWSNRKIMTNTVWYHLHVESKIWCKLTYLWNRNRLWGIENRLAVAKGEGCEGEMDWEFGISRSKLLYIGWVNKVPCIAQETIMTKNMK